MSNFSFAYFLPTVLGGFLQAKSIAGWYGVLPPTTKPIIPTIAFDSVHAVRKINSPVEIVK
jgi:hypothetical protein